MKAYDVCMHLKAGTVVVSTENKVKVILVIEDSVLVNPFNGSTAYYHEWFNLDEEVELFEDMEDYLSCHYTKIVLDKEERTG